MFRIALATTLLTFLGACAGASTEQEKQLINEAERSGNEAQLAYLQCRYTVAAGTCQQAAWRKYSHPDLGNDLDRETVHEYIAAMEMLGARDVLRQQAYNCPRVTSLDTMLFKDSLEIGCSNGMRYQLDHAGENWQIADRKHGYE